MNVEKVFKVETECQSCNGTGLYSGIAESDGVAVVCNKCDGTGKYIHIFKYKDWLGRNKRDDVKRVYLPTRYKLGLGTLVFKGVGTIDMNKEGVSYDEFLEGKMPNHIEILGCPMLADQEACHKIKGFVDKCNDLNGGLVGTISSCNYQCKALECWKRFRL